MKKALFMLSLFLTLSCEISYSSSGIANKLVGDVNVVSIFVSDYNVPFTKEVKNGYIEMLMNAESWIANQALRYGKTVRFNNFYHCSYDNTFIYKDKITVSEKGSIGVLTSVFGSYRKAVSTAQTLGDNTIFIIFTPLYSFKCFSYVSFNEEEPLEVSVISKWWNYDYPERKSLEIAHELLHTFGAIDFYTVDDFKPGYEKYFSHFDNSIMKRLAYHYNELYIDDITAYLIGWGNKKYSYFSYYNVK